MEFIIAALLTALLWISSLTVFLPFLILLMYSQPFRNKWFSFFYTNFVLTIFGRQMMSVRKRCFEILKENLHDRRKSTPIKILEIGVGPGPNLPLYPENSFLTAVDKNPSFQEYFFENQSKYPQVRYERAVTCMAENMSEIEDSTMDVVIATYLLCSVNDIPAVLREVKRVLKPGGKYLFMEHVAFSREEWGYLLQKFIASLWYIYCNGCRPDRRTPNEIQKAGFSNIICEEKYPSSLPIWMRPQLLGIATVE